MHRFYLSNLPQPPRQFSLSGSEAAHAAKVLRVRPGEEVTVLDGRGTRVLATVSKVSRMQVSLDVQRLEQAAHPSFQITLFQSVIKPRCMDWVVEKATELGVHRLQPILTERVISRIDPAEAHRKAAKWQRTAVEALKQCGSLWLPRIEPPQPLADILRGAGQFHCLLVASLAPDAGALRHAIQGVRHPIDAASPVQVGLWIGPEGDFSPHELSSLLSAGATPITLGTNVLRSETAAVCALAQITYELGIRASIEPAL